MKKIYSWLLLSVMVVFGFDVFAQKTEINGVWYDQFNEYSQDCYVTYPKEGKYSGTVEIPESVTLNGKKYFVFGIGDNSFYRCADLHSVVMPKSLKVIGYSAFGFCENMKIVNLPDSLVTIQSYAFRGCKSISSLKIPSKVKYLDDGFLQDCPKLNWIMVDSKNEYFTSLQGVLYSKDKTKLYRVPPTKKGDYVVDSSVRTIKAYALDGCDKLTSIKMDDNLERIESYAFQNCKNAKPITLGQSVKYIEQCAFDSCNTITHLTLPNSVEVFKGYLNCEKLVAFWVGSKVKELEDGIGKGCPNLNTITVMDDNPYYSDRYGILYTKAQDSLVCCPRGKEGDFNIPETVKCIRGYALGFSEGLTSINVPESVTLIKSGAILGCRKLQKVTIGRNVKEMLGVTFEDCPVLKEIVVDANNQNYKSVDGILFKKDGSRLYRVPSAMAKTSYIIPSEVQIITGYAFEGCSLLTNLTIGANVNLIGFNAFKDSMKEGEIHMLNPEPIVIKDAAFSPEIEQNVTLYVPNAQAVEAYRNADLWKNFVDIRAEGEGSVAEITTETVNVFANGRTISIVGLEADADVKIFNVSGQLVACGFNNQFEMSQRGIYIVRVAGKTFKVAVR